MFTDLPEVIVYPEVQTKTEGENMTLSCNVAGNPAPTISWSRNGSPLNTTGRISFLDSKTQLTITNVNRVDSGEYRCVASNSLGNITSSVATLNVQCKYIVLCFKTEHVVSMLSL